MEPCIFRKFDHEFRYGKPKTIIEYFYNGALRQ